jgi:hypothetical protein
MDVKITLTVVLNIEPTEDDKMIFLFDERCLGWCDSMGPDLAQRLALAKVHKATDLLGTVTIGEVTPFPELTEPKQWCVVVFTDQDGHKFGGYVSTYANWKDDNGDDWYIEWYTKMTPEGPKGYHYTKQQQEKVVKVQFFEKAPK